MQRTSRVCQIHYFFSRFLNTGPFTCAMNTSLHTHSLSLSLFVIAPLCRCLGLVMVGDVLIQISGPCCCTRVTALDPVHLLSETLEVVEVRAEEGVHGSCESHAGEEG